MTTTTTTAPARKPLLPTEGRYNSQAMWVYDPETPLLPESYPGATRYTRDGIAFDGTRLTDNTHSVGFGSTAVTLALTGHILALGTTSDEGKVFDDYHPYTNLSAIVWSPSEGRVHGVSLASISSEAPRGELRVPFDPTPDATPEVRQAYDAYVRGTIVPRIGQRRAELKCSEWENNTLGAINAITDTPVRGGTYRVVKGRKHPKGLTGTLFWTGTDNYGTLKYGLATSDRKDPATGRNADVIFIAAANVEPVLNAEKDAEVKRLSALLARKDEFLKAAIARETATALAEYEAGTLSPSQVLRAA
jgi:hypothetical protein